MGKSASSARALWAQRLAGHAAGAIVPTGVVALPSATRGTPVLAVGALRPTYEGVVLGIDPSLRGTGLAVVAFRKGARPEVLASLTLRQPARRPFAECLGDIHRAITTLVASHPVRHVALELTIYVQNVQTAQILGAARGAAIAAVAVAGLEIHEYPPMRVKQAVVGYGRASKEQVIGQVGALTGAKSLPSDEADATAVALCHAFTWRG